MSRSEGWKPGVRLPLRLPATSPLGLHSYLQGTPVPPVPPSPGAYDGLKSLLGGLRFELNLSRSAKPGAPELPASARHLPEGLLSSPVLRFDLFW